MRYQNEPERWQLFNWYTVNQMDTASIQLSPVAGNTMSIEKKSVWALFRLLKTATITPLSDNILKAEWILKTNQKRYPVTVLLKEANHYRILHTLLLKRFSLPKRLFENDLLDVNAFDSRTG